MRNPLSHITQSRMAVRREQGLPASPVNFQELNEGVQELVYCHFEVLREIWLDLARVSHPWRPSEFLGMTIRFALEIPEHLQLSIHKKPSATGGRNRISIKRRDRRGAEEDL
ncbi:hypothetical protein Pr1d_11300 [Bythopirellula goksoeyrii]|uniref:Uncharacterized protein n=1 Tax=Bythopirellula goksoeyrii TaxID=1400387 RepID=A0A5B9Q807_9BACT|nr:hypothetical protein Pr1d_11300 [Bythopirellula goksoeyrii]